MSFAGLEHVVRENEPMSAHTWLRLGGPAQYFAEPTSVEELQRIVQQAAEQECAVRLLGGGSNVLIREQGVAGIVIRLAAPAFCGLRIEGQRLIAGGGSQLSHAVSTAVGAGLAGLESLVGIPGAVGGALRGNATGSLGDIGQWTTQASVMTHTGEIKTRVGDLAFAYGESNLDELAILEAQFELEPEDREDLIRRLQRQWIVKQSRQPVSGAAAGRLFRDAGGMPATELIEQAGLRGFRCGQAALSERDPNYVVVDPEGASEDVIRLIDQVRQAVEDRTGLVLELSLECW